MDRSNADRPARGRPAPARRRPPDPRALQADPRALQADPRALQAMAEAARRAREARDPGTPGRATPPMTAAPPGPGPTTPPATPAPRAAPRRRPSRRTRHQRLLVSVTFVAGMLLASSVALAVSLAGHRGAAPVADATAGSVAASTPRAPRTPTPAPRRRRTSTPARSRASGRPATSTAARPAVAGAAPVVSALNPPEGQAGQTVTITGANFFSSDGEILARFNGQVAPTSCPVQTTCSAVVPSLAGSPSAVRVTVTTAAGTSNAVTMTYG